MTDSKEGSAGDLEGVRERIEQHQQRVNATHAAIGRYFVEFSRLISHMRNALQDRMRRPEDPPQLISVAFGGSGADQICTAFFALCKEIGGLDENDLTIFKYLRGKLREEIIKPRNDYAHGDWFVEMSRLMQPPGVSNTYVYRQTPSRGVGGGAIHVDAELLNSNTDYLISIGMAISELGMICFDTHPLKREGERLGISEFYVLSGDRNEPKKLTRNGPRSSEIEFGW